MKEILSIEHAGKQGHDRHLLSAKLLNLPSIFGIQTSRTSRRELVKKCWDVLNVLGSSKRISRWCDWMGWEGNCVCRKSRR